jgi:hypothetical protein
MTVSIMSVSLERAVMVFLSITKKSKNEEKNEKFSILSNF